VKSGLIVAGGRSTRFGDADKAIADVGGRPMIRHVADRVADAVEELVVNCRPAQTDAIRDAMADSPLPVRYAIDGNPDRGPVAGIHNGLEVAGGEYAFVVACDMPLVDPALGSALFELARSHEAAVPRPGSGYLQSLQAVYHVDATRRACARVLDSGNPAVHDVLDRLDCRVIDGSELAAISSRATFENVNTRADLESVRERLG
jgi:molybdopterin-guanine dinucleotide biosynthesis protein A